MIIANIDAVVVTHLKTWGCLTAKENSNEEKEFELSNFEIASIQNQKNIMLNI